VRRAPARLIDITTRGAGLVTHRPAEFGQTVWLGVEALPCEWVRAIIRAVSPDGSQWRYHLAFCEPCPVGLLEQATTGAPRGETPLALVLHDDEETHSFLHFFWGDDHH
jgi:hypothetical protein